MRRSRCKIRPPPPDNRHVSMKFLLSRLQRPIPNLIACLVFGAVLALLMRAAVKLLF
jgi:hypothetical protein